MMARIARTSLLFAALALAGCNESSMSDFVPNAGKSLPSKILTEMSAKGMSRNSPVLARIFKEEGKLEVWKQKNNGRYDIIATYDICKYSGKLGPKFIEGDRQAPEGFYTVRPAQMNPNSKFHLSFNIGYPNAYDRAHGRSGSNLMVHGGCSSSGCYSMKDDQIEQIYLFARESFTGGQTEFQIQAYPFRMTAANMARYRNDPNYAFWKNLKEGYDHFEVTKVPPKVDVCEKRYVFNQVTDGKPFSPTGACPISTQPPALASAYQSYQAQYEAAFASAAGGSAAPTKPSIKGIQEAKIVQDWTHRRARGERISIEPPSLEEDGSVVATSRMGRIDSPAGRRMAALEAEAAAKKKAEEEKLAAKKRAEEEKAAAIAAAKAEKEAAEAAAEAAKAVPAAPAEAVPAEGATETAEAPAQEEKKSGLLGSLGSVRKRIGSIFGS
jgi:murein L,D-transpeptidase YafK